MADYRRLLKILEAEAASQEKLLQLLISERSAIITLRNDELEKIAQEKNKILSKSKKLGDERNEIISELNLGPVEEIKLEKIAGSCEDYKLRADLLSVGGELKSVVTQVKTMNDHNAELIKSSIGLVLSTISIFRGAPDADLPVYESSGKLRNDKDGAIRRSMPLSREG